MLPLLSESTLTLRSCAPAMQPGLKSNAPPRKKASSWANKTSTLQRQNDPPPALAPPPPLIMPCASQQISVISLRACRTALSGYGLRLIGPTGRIRRLGRTGGISARNLPMLPNSKVGQVRIHACDALTALDAGS